MPFITVNSKPTIKVPFIVVNSSERVVSSTLLIKIANAVESMPVKIRIPKKYGQVVYPKIYMIAYAEVGAGVNIQDIVGIRMYDLASQPSPWCYTKGYWHPMINVMIANALRKAAENGSVSPELLFERD